MKKLIYQGDSTSHSGKVLTGTDRIKVKGQRAARIGDTVSCPMHGDNRIIEGSPRIKLGATLLARDGDHTECGAYLIASRGGASVR
jgi:uncharacterized Zn-binding protein involved in type VI secretion